MNADVECRCCGMPCDPGENHPYAACLMFKACQNSQAVYSNLQAVRDSALRDQEAEIARHGRRCPNCPLHDTIDVPAHLEGEA